MGKLGRARPIVPWCDFRFLHELAPGATLCSQDGNPDSVLTLGGWPAKKGLCVGETERTYRDQSLRGGHLNAHPEKGPTMPRRERVEL